MGANKRKQQSDSDYTDEDEGSEVDIEEEVIEKIKELPTLKEKIHAIAINSYIIEKREIDTQMAKETEAIEHKYRTQFRPFVSEMNDIITGNYKFTDTDLQEFTNLFKQEEHQKVAEHLNPSKIPEYWLKVFLNSGVISEIVEERDEPLLKHLEKIESEKAEDLSKLTLYFYFSENEWFSNQKVAKVFDLEDGEVTKTYGDSISWKEGKNTTEKIVKKKAKKGGKKTKTVKERSFFNIFRGVNPEDLDSQSVSQNGDEDEFEELELQEEVAFTIHEDLIPKSIEYYLNLAFKDEQQGSQKAKLSNQAPASVDQEE